MLEQLFIESYHRQFILKAVASYDLTYTNSNQLKIQAVTVGGATGMAFSL